MNIEAERTRPKITLSLL